MKKSITQEFEYGCGIACFAFVLGVSYKDALGLLSSKQATSDRFWVKDLNKALVDQGLLYERKYVKPHIFPYLLKEGAIVLIGRSKKYPSGHYLVRHKNTWMDPWINLPRSKNILAAKSGFRKRLPGIPKYVIYPLA
ncbi:hypothetical protein KC930_00305 [Candidatus Saccharibacteria bacterium]|nr:hypothetical protein [Candidatus Saccharibacteria bacterium]